MDTKHLKLRYYAMTHNETIRIEASISHRSEQDFLFTSTCTDESKRIIWLND